MLVLWHLDRNSLAHKKYSGQIYPSANYGDLEDSGSHSHLPFRWSITGSKRQQADYLRDGSVAVLKSVVLISGYRR